MLKHGLTSLTAAIISSQTSHPADFPGTVMGPAGGNFKASSMNFLYPQLSHFLVMSLTKVSFRSIMLLKRCNAGTDGARGAY